MVEDGITKTMPKCIDVIPKHHVGVSKRPSQTQPSTRNSKQRCMQSTETSESESEATRVTSDIADKDNRTLRMRTNNKLTGNIRSDDEMINLVDTILSPMCADLNLQNTPEHSKGKD